MTPPAIEKVLEKLGASQSPKSIAWWLPRLGLHVYESDKSFNLLVIAEIEAALENVLSITKYPVLPEGDVGVIVCFLPATGPAPIRATGEDFFDAYIDLAVKYWGLG